MRRRTTNSLLATAIVMVFATAPASAQLAGLTTLEPEIIDLGAEPRQELRYRFTEGQTETMALDMAMDVASTMADETLADLAMVVSAEVDAVVTEVYADGSAHIEMVFMSYNFEDVGDPIADAELRAMGDELAGLTMWQVLDDRGNIVDLGFDALADLDPAMQQQVLDTSLAVHPLPLEAVGEGARWVAAGTIVSEGMPMDMTVETDVLELDDDGVVLGLTITGDAGATASFLGDVQPGVEIAMERYAIDGGGEVAVGFDSLIPNSEAELDMEMLMSIVGTEAGETVELDLGFEMTMGMVVYQVD